MEENQHHGVSTPFSSSSSHSFDTTNTLSKMEYYGLKKRHLLKTFWKDLIQLSNYTFSVSPPFQTTHKVMSVIRIMQFLLPCFIPAYFGFWKKGTADQVTMNFLAVLYYLLPPTAVFRAAHILLIVYDVLECIIIIIVIFSAYYYKKYAKLPLIIPSFINFYHSTFGYYFHPIILYIIFESFSYLTSNENRMQISKTNFIILSIISFICIIFNFMFMLTATSQTLLFRPNSLASMTSNPRYIIIFVTTFINILFGLAINLSKPFQIVFFSINIFLYLFTIFSVFTYGGFIQIATSNIVLSSSIAGAVFTLVDLIFIILEKYGSLAIFFSFLVFFALMMIVNFFVLQHIRIRQLRLLDTIYQDKELFTLIKSPNQFLQLATVGFNYAHPLIIDLSFFIMGIERWKKNQLIYFIYAKFIAIYPEETITLKYIYQTVKIQKLSGSAINCIKKQTRMIMNQRESGLTNELRSKINSIKKQIRSTKHKLGHLWDVVIRGNLSEIEVATKHGIQAINETNVNFKHLLHDFQNNRNVTHFYAIFLKEVMADHALSDDMHKKTKLLQHLSAVTIEDQMHEYGMKMFPNLPSFLKTKETTTMVSTIDAVPQYANDINDNDYEKDKERNLNQIAGLKETIEKLRIPSIFGTKVILILTFLLCFFIPCFIGLIYINFYIERLKRPLKFIGALSQLSSYATQVLSFSIRYIGESLMIFNKLDNQEKDPPKSFGYSWDTKEQLEYILNETTYALQDFGTFRMFEENNHYINQVQSLIFQNTVPYKYYLSTNTTTVTMISIQAAILDFTIQTKMILNGNNISQSILSTGVVLNPVNNINIISCNIRNAMNLMIQYIKNNYEDTVNIGKILMIVIIVVIILIYGIILIIEIKWINSNKQETYQCLFSLPKNIVSELAENRFSKNGNKQSEEMNKQDENILKIFHSGGSSEDSFSDSFMLIFGTILLILLSISCTILFVALVENLSKIVRNSAPHLHYLLASYSHSLNSINYLHIMFFELTGNKIFTHDSFVCFVEMLDNFEISRDYYHLMNTGGPLAEEVPFKRFMDGVRSASPTDCNSSNLRSFISKIKRITKNKEIKNENEKLKRTFSKVFIKSEFNDLSAILQCSPVDITFILIEPIISYAIAPYRAGEIEYLDPTATAFETIWLQMISPIYDRFFEPMHGEIIPAIDQELRDKKNQIIPIIISFLIISIFVEIILYHQISKIENHIRSVLRLLLHCKPSVVFSSLKITRVLSGDFSIQKNDSLGRSSNFFDTVFKSLPDAIMYANSDMIIQSANQACKSTFGEIELVGKSIKDFFMSNNFNGNIEILFSSVNSNPTEEIAYKLEGSSDLRILKASSMIACGMFVMSCRNVTQSHRYNTLILEEKQNSDKLLKTILPPSLVSRVQEGEKNISFSVQSASILFCDIVSFTPWCGSLPAETVMSTLNILFKRFDSILDSKPTMTKIKCIGDCYMAAGGIFAELNQPAIHAKEVVSFGLQGIKEIVLINEEINQNLKIRIGINTGGPIVAGVLGIGKPTFEILGPAINRAQQMEQNGVPMKVHISMPVYELICGFNFKFSTRRQINIKNELVDTYLVEP